MSERSGFIVVIFLALAITVFASVDIAQATRLPADMSQHLKQQFEGASLRLDGSFATTAGDLYLPLMPAGTASKKAKTEIEARLPDDGKAPDLVSFTNGWMFLRVIQRGEARTIILPKNLPEKLKKRLNGLHFPSDLIVPEGFVLPRSLKSLVQDVSVTLVDDSILSSADFGTKKKSTPKGPYTGSGTVFLTSITSGSIIMLDGKTLNKLAEFPTEGTPSSMQFTGGQLYIADQAKNRLLILDPLARKFLGQIDLAPKSAPKGIAALPNGKWLYVSESGAQDVAVVETASGKVLLKTKVRPGPGRIAITPDGTYLIVLNVTSGEVTVISTYNQKVISTLKVGDMPTALVVSPDGKLVYISNRHSNTVSILKISERQLTGSIKTGNSPTGIALSPDGKKLYVANGRDNTVTVYDTTTLNKLSEIKLPEEIDFPGSLCMLPDGKRLLVASQQTGNIAILDTETLDAKKQINLSHSTHEMIWEPVP